MGLSVDCLLTKDYNYMNRFVDLTLRKLLLCLPMSAGVAVAATNATVSVYPDKVGQTVGGIGGGIVYYQDWLTNHPNREAIYDTLFNGLGISCLRMGNWAQEDIPSDNTIVANDAIIYKAAKLYCGDKLPVVMTSWTPPAYLKANNSRTGSTQWAKATLKKENGRYVYDKFGKWWAESLGRYHKQGVFPDYISIQNEPDCDTSYDCMILDAKESNTVAGYGPALSAVAAQVKQMPNAPKIVGPENIGIGWNKTQEYVNNLDRKQLDGYSFHYYHSGTNEHEGDRYSFPNDFIEAQKGLASAFTDKPMFMTENSALRDTKPMDAIYTAWFLANAFNINKVQYYTHWNLIWGDEGESCISLQKWDSTYKAPWNGGFKTQSTYHGLRHFSKYVRPGMKLIDTWASTGQMTTCGFKSAEGDAYTLIFINQGNTDLSVSHDLPIDNKLFDSKVILTVPNKNIYSSYEGPYNGSVTMPANSVVTISYTKAHPVVSPYVYIYDESVKDPDWTNGANWNTGCKPWPTDSVLLYSGECKVSNFNHLAPVVVLNNATFRLIGDVTVNNTIHMFGGTLKVYTDNPGFMLQGKGISVEQPSTINVGHEETTFHLFDELYGSAALNMTGVGTLDLRTTNRDYTGTWYVRGGTLLATAEDALGAGNVEVMTNALLKVDAPCVIHNLRLEHDSTLLLNDTLTAENVYFDELTLPNGRYTNQDYPKFIMGDGMLIVNHAYPVLVQQGEEDDSEQIVGLDTAIVEINYVWENAETVEVDWNPHQPQGIDVQIKEWEQTVSLSGVPTETGEFIYSISTVSIEDSIFVMKGIIKVVDPNADSTVSSAAISLADEMDVYVAPLSVNRGEKSVLHINSPVNTHANVSILSATGVQLAMIEANVRQGANNAVLPLNSLPTGFYLVKVDVAGVTKTLKIQIK